MSCYFRHLEEILVEAGIEVTPSNRKQVDQAVHKVVGVEYKECPVAWRALKQHVLVEEKTRREFLKKFKGAMG